MNTSDAVSLFPGPPDHFRVFFSPSALEPPKAALLETGEVFPSFGRPVPNLKTMLKRKFEAPPIDNDVVLYDRQSSDLGGELRKIANLFPGAIDEMFVALISEPETVNRPLRKIDNIVKNIFHICEVARNTREPYAVAVALAQRRLAEKRKLLDHLRTAVQDARKVVDSKFRV